jgi:chromosomal replication initiator protein
VATDDTEIVSALRAKLVEKIGVQRYELWFGQATRLVLGDAGLIVEVSSPFYQTWLRDAFREDLEEVCADVVCRPVPVQFRVDTTLAPAAGNRCLASPSPNGHEPVDLRAEPVGRDGERTEHAVRRPRHATESNGSAKVFVAKRTFADFSTFVQGPGNRMACTSAQLAAQRPGKVSPLILYGSTGTGKTHLLEAIWTAARAAHRGIRALYLPAERFTTSFLEALGGRGLPSFRQKCRGVDLLLLDDLQFFAGKKATLGELLHTMDSLLADGKQLVMAGDRAPAELDGLGTELMARLSGGLTVRMESPDYATRLGILRGISRRLELALSDDVLALVATQFASNARELTGVLHRLQLLSLADEQPITRSMAECAIADLKAQLCSPVQLPDIQRAVCNVFGIPAENLQSKRKGPGASHPRVLAMWLARKHTRAALSEIGHFFGRRSHSSVISAQKKVEGWMRAHQRVTLSKQTCGIEEAIRRVEEMLRIA